MYFRRFGVVEIQKTFYQLPSLKTAERWRLEAPSGFEVLMKAWQLITHEATSPTYRRLTETLRPEAQAYYGCFQPTKAVAEAWERTFEWAKVVGATHILFQCPARFQPSEENIRNMRAFFRGIDRGGLRMVWEPRGAWPEARVKQLCEELDLIHAVDPFKSTPLYGDRQYFRLHGPRGYASRYSEADLRELQGWACRKKTYALFNNQTMKEDAIRFQEMIE